MPSDTYTLTISDTGVSIPSSHAASHITGGGDPIPTVTSSVSGLMSPAIFNQHTDNTAKVSNITHTGDVTDTGGVIKVTKINNTQMSSLATGIVKNTNGTGIPSIAIAADFPVLNQSTTGNALTATTAAKATNIVGGATGSIPYQTANDSTALLSSGVSGTVLKSNGAAAPSWSVVEKSMLSAALSTEITDNTAKVSNITHTGDVTDTGGVIKVTKINNTQMSSLATGIVKNTNGTGIPSIAIAADFPTLNQNTTGNATTATNLSGGSTGSIPYQSAAGTTVLLAGSSGTFLKSNGAAAPAWVSIAKTDLSPALQTEITNAATTAINATTADTATTATTAISATTAGTATTATNLSGGSTGSIPYQSAAGTTVLLAGNSGTFLKSNGAAAPAWVSIAKTDLSPALQTEITNAATTAINATTAVNSTNLVGGSGGSLPYQSSGGVTAMLPAALSGFLKTNGSAAPSWSAISLSDITGTLSAASGGTGQTLYSIGDILYSNSTTSLEKLPSTFVGNVLVSGGIGVAPFYSKVGLTTHVSGILPIANGGTGTSSGVSLADASGVLPVANGGTNTTTSTGTGSVVLSTSPTLVTPVLGTPAAGSILTNCTGLPMETGVVGVLPVANGGTGYTTDGASVFKFDTTPATTAANAGELSWNTTDGTLDLKLDNGVTLQVGQETNIKVYSATTIANGKVVYISGGVGGLPEVSLADYSNIDAKKTLGIATQNIIGGTYGYVTLIGLVRDLNLITMLGSPISSGQSVWLGASGALTKIEPAYPFAKVKIGHIVNATDLTGSIHVNVGFESDGTVNGTGKIGYANGAGGNITQVTSKSTGVTLDKTTGSITMSNEALAGNTTVSFTLTNSKIETDDVLILNHSSVGTVGTYVLNAQCHTGSATINVRNVSNSSLNEAIIISFVVIRGSIV